MMKTGVWVAILVAVVFSSFLVGYAVPPMVEVGMIGGGGRNGEIGQKSKVDEATKEYYRSLAVDDSEEESEDE